MREDRKPWEGRETNDKISARLDDAQREQRRVVQEDVVVEFPRRLFIRSSGGIYFKVDVDDDGNLSTTNMGGNPF